MTLPTVALFDVDGTLLSSGGAQRLGVWHGTMKVATRDAETISNMGHGVKGTS